MRMIFVFAALFSSASSFAATKFGVHSCVPANPLETHLTSVEITGYVADFSSTSINYAATVRYKDTFSRQVQSQFRVEISDEGGIGSPNIYVNDNFNLSVDFSPAPGSDGSLRLATIDFVPQDASEISATLVCKTPILL